MQWKIFFKPTRIKLFLCFSFSLVHILYLIKKFRFDKLISIFFAHNLQDYLILYLISFLLFAILYYPFTCSIMFLYTFYKNKASSKKDIIITILILIFLNPFPSLVFSFPATPKITSIPYTYPCGAKVVGYFDIPDNPAIKAGIKINETIYIINNRKFKFLEELKKILGDFDPGQTITVGTQEGNFYTLTLSQKNDGGKPFMGLELMQAVCREINVPV